MFLEYLEKPLGDVAIVSAEKHGVDKITGLNGGTGATSGTVGENNTQSLIGGEDVVDNSLEKGIVDGLQGLKPGQRPSPFPVHIWILRFNSRSLGNKILPHLFHLFQW